MKNKRINNRMNIALCIGMLESDFSHEICEGALMAAKDLDVNLFVLPGGILALGDTGPNDERNLKYHYQYNSLFSYLSDSDFDAIIIEYGVITSLLEPEKKREFLKSVGDIPVILLAGAEEGYQSITIDNKPGIRQAVGHLVTEHNCTKVAYVSGPKTNQDAIERLEAYKEAVKEYGIEDSERLIAYGDFTEYYPEITEKLITENPDIEAIVYANDQMAVSGYRAMKSLGLEPGKDILITGFDDSPFAMMMEPYMTSVRVDVREIGYKSVMLCPDLIKGKEVKTTVPSRLVIRESCGCSNTNIVKSFSEKMFAMNKEDAAEFFTNDFMEKYINSIYQQAERDRVRNIIYRYLLYCFHLTDDDKIAAMDKDEFKYEYHLFEEIYAKGYIELEVLFLTNQIIYGYISSIVKNDLFLRWLLEQISFSSNTSTDIDNKKKLIANERNKIFESFLTNITGDILQQVSFSNDSQRFESVINKLQRMSYKSSYIYVFLDKFVYVGDMKWTHPAKCYLRASHDGKIVSCYDELEKIISCNDIFSKENLPTSHRFDMLVLPLFSNNIQFGITLMEVEIESYRFAQQIACQISVTLEVLDIMKEQNQIKQKLELSLAQSVETNKLLDEMSRMDPMTGVTNRRGFFHIANEMVKSKSNYGRRAVAVYADMDCLKVINDKFGHEDGDFSLKTIADSCFRKNDVVGRMGGDEFAAFAILNQDNYGAVLKKRIQDSLAEFNETCNKPYYINMSVGYYEFIIDDDVNIEEVLRLADENLYLEKKNKIKKVYKDGYEPD